MTTPALLTEIHSLWESQPPPIATIAESEDSDPLSMTPSQNRLYNEACEYFDNITEAMSEANPIGLESIIEFPYPMVHPCFRCGGTQSYVQIIHDGDSLRRDCSQCGRFIDFPTWHERELTHKIVNAFRTHSVVPSADDSPLLPVDATTSSLLVPVFDEALASNS